MKKNRVLSAVLAVMMLISMIACIALPAAALDYTTLPLASTATWGDGKSAYQVNSVGELIAMNMAAKQSRDGANIYAGDGDYSNDNFEPDDVIYLTADLDMNDWNWQAYATYTEGVGYVPAKLAVADTSSNCNMVYVDNTENKAFATQKELFSALYNGMATGTKSGRNYMVSRFTFDGLNHTIKNYTSKGPLFAGNFVGIIQNLIFDGAVVTNQAHNATYSSQASIVFGGSTYTTDATNAANSTGWTKNAYSVTMDNVHILNSTVIPTIGANAGLFFNTINDQGKNKDFNVKNCSAVNSYVKNTAYTASTGSGLLAGYINVELDAENLFFYNCGVTVKTGANYNLLASTLGNNYPDWNLNNVAIANCNFVAEDAEPANVAIVSKTLQFNLEQIYNNLYLCNNTCSTSEEGTKVPLTSAFIHANVAEKYTGTITANNVVGNALTAVASGNAVTVDATAANTVANLTLETVINEMNGNVPANGVYWTADAVKGVATSATAVASNPSVKFVFDDKTVMGVADATGKVTFDAETKALLAAETWADSEGQDAVLDYDNLTIAADTVYTVATHKLTYTAEANNTHSVTCSRCTEHTATGVACTPVAVPENDVAASYFAKAKKAYKCEFCTNTWFEEVVDSTYDAPYSVAFDAAEYVNNDAEVVVTVTPKADANMSGMHLDLAFSADYLDYVDYAPSAATVVVNEVTEGNLVIAMAKADGTTLTEADAITLTFKVQGLSNSVINAALTAAATLTQTTVGTGDDLAVMEALTKTVAATSAASYLDFEAGDVNSDGYVDLLDAVLIIQKLNGAIGTAQDAAFKLIAADVNNSGDVNTADVTLVLQYVCEMDVTFTPAVQEPTIVVVGA